MTATAPEVPEDARTSKLRIPHPEDMDRETFCQHMQFRHADSLPVKFVLSLVRMDDYVYDCWLQFHERLHRLRVHIENEDFQTGKEYDHTHLPRQSRRRKRLA